MRIYKLHSTLTNGTVNSAAQLDIVEDGKIRAFAWSVRPSGMNAFDDVVRGEISFASTNTLDNNDVRQSITEISGSQQFLTDGGGVTALNMGLSGLDINVIAGERIHLHTIGSGGLGGDISCYLYVDDGSGGRTRTRRLR